MVYPGGLINIKNRDTVREGHKTSKARGQTPSAIHTASYNHSYFFNTTAYKSSQLYYTILIGMLTYILH